MPFVFHSLKSNVLRYNRFICRQPIIFWQDKNISIQQMVKLLVYSYDVYYLSYFEIVYCQLWNISLTSREYFASYLFAKIQKQTGSKMIYLCPLLSHVKTTIFIKLKKKKYSFILFSNTNTLLTQKSIKHFPTFTRMLHFIGQKRNTLIKVV